MVAEELEKLAGLRLLLGAEPISPPASRRGNLVIRRASVSTPDW